MAALRGEVFSMGARLEELLSDARGEQTSSLHAELAVRRRCMEFESSTSSRLAACESACNQAKQASQETRNSMVSVCTQVQELSAQVRALVEASRPKG
mmetsp:Transcript_91394/g.241151  ORF Transcript_91394/g.241151 Transcript_91394/m.241151 type:complete len:98 (+) Transcript_91394:3-296(+)